MPHISATRRNAFWLFLAYLIFVIYGSLLPFEYRDHTLEEALALFANIRYLNLGVSSRADWVANIVLYVPLAFLCCAWLPGMRETGTRHHFALLPALVICLCVAVAVEFTQIFFAPRTVSLNDLLAETLGTLGGIGLWAFGRFRIMQLRDSFAMGGRQSVLAASITYGLAYLALSLFPYDFLVSPQELAWKLESGNQGWLIAGGCSDWVRCSARLAGDALAIAPLGLLLRLAFPRSGLRQLFIGGIALGLALEGLQFLLASGTSQGLSIVLRAAGLVAGAMLGEMLKTIGAAPVARLIWRATPIVVLPYLLLLAALAGWFTAPWLPPGEALARLTEVRILPFYYHYFSTEPAAMASLLANAAMYAPIGGLLWARHTSGVRVRNRGARSAALWAIALALPIELGKLLVTSKHPDLTNLLIAAGAAAFTYTLASWIEHVLTGKAPIKPPSPKKPATTAPDEPGIHWPRPHPGGLIPGIPAALTVLAGVASYPLLAPHLAVLLLGYGVLLWRRPLLWLFVLPAMLPVLDFSPITGKLLLDEFDLVVLVTLAVGYMRVSRHPPLPWPNRLLPASVILLWISWIIATARGLWPLLGTDSEILAYSHSPFEAWQVGKGLLWALLLIPLVRRVPPDAIHPALCPQWPGFRPDHGDTGGDMGAPCLRWPAGLRECISCHRHICQHAHRWRLYRSLHCVCLPGTRDMDAAATPPGNEGAGSRHGRTGQLCHAGHLLAGRVCGPGHGSPGRCGRCTQGTFRRIRISQADNHRARGDCRCGGRAGSHRRLCQRPPDPGCRGLFLSPGTLGTCTGYHGKRPDRCSCRNGLRTVSNAISAKRRLSQATRNL